MKNDVCRPVWSDFCEPNEIVVVDSVNADATKDIANKYTEQVFEVPLARFWATETSRC